MQNARVENVVPLNGAGRGIGGGSRSSVPALVPYPRWQAACEKASGALLGGQRVVLVIGPAGTGKSLLLDQAAKVMKAAGWSTVLRQADPTLPPGRTGTSLLMVDEADRLDPEVLRRLVMTATGPLLLAGLEPLGARVPGVATVSLPALSREEARDYIAQWLALTGRSPANLETAGMRRLVELSGGVPRLISTLLSAAAWLAESSGESVMTQVHIEESAALRSSLSPHEPEPPSLASLPAVPLRRRGALSSLLPVVSGMLLVGAAAFLAGRYFPDELRRAAGGAGRTITAWQMALQGRIDTGWRPVPTDIVPTIEPPAPVVATAAPPKLQSAPVIAEPPPPAEPALSQAAIAEPVVAPPPAPAQAPEAIAPVFAPAPLVASVAPVAPLASVAPAAPVQPEERPVVKAPPLSVQTVDLLLRRGHEMLSLGDVSAARLLFRKAADAGNAGAMLAMGQTYDPEVIAQSKLLLAPDRAEARSWYRRAVAAGSKEARVLLERLGS